MIKAGILSDTHLAGVNNAFLDVISHCFAKCDIIIHAGDLTDISILKAFGKRKVYAVHGNMCNPASSRKLAHDVTFSIHTFTFGLTHGAGLGYDIESALWDLFPEVDCVIYGHTHKAVCHTTGNRLIINPGSFQPTGRYGAPGTYVILDIGEQLQATIHEISYPA